MKQFLGALALCLLLGLYLLQDNKTHLYRKYSSKTTLKLNATEVMALAPVAEQLEQLTQLELRLNEDNEDILAIIGQFTSLKSLRILGPSRSPRPWSLPASITQLEQLEHLEVQSIYLTGIPQEVAQLKQLKTLIFNYCFKNSSIDVLGEMASLEHIDLSNNGLQALPANFCDLPHLKTLKADHNNIWEVPEALLIHPTLEVLSLKNNDLNGIGGTPKVPTGACALKELYLNQNTIMLLDNDFQYLTQLQRLEVRDNQLQALPPALSQLQQLEVLDLRKNPIETWPMWLNDLPSLRRLQVSPQAAQPMPDWLLALSGLKDLEATLGLGYEQVTDWDEEGRILGLKLFQEDLEALPKPLPAFLHEVRHLELVTDQLMWPNWLNDLQRIEVLAFKGTEQVIPSPDFSFEAIQLPKIRIFHCRGHQMKEVPSAVQGWDQLEQVALMDVGLEQLPDPTQTWPKLRWLLVQNNQLKSLPAQMGVWTALKQLNLANNALTCLPKSLLPLKEQQLERVELTGNPVDDQLQWQPLKYWWADEAVWCEGL